MALRYFEDFAVGETIELGSRGVTQDEILAFAREYDPQYFHTDPEAAAKSSFGGLVASGWHICALFMRLLVDGMLHETASIASPGVGGIRWLRPMRPGDVLSARTTITDATPSRSRPDRGLLKHRGELSNQKGEMVASMRLNSLVGRRPTAGAS